MMRRLILFFVLILFSFSAFADAVCDGRGISTYGSDVSGACCAWWSQYKSILNPSFNYTCAASLPGSECISINPSGSSMSAGGYCSVISSCPAPKVRQVNGSCACPTGQFDDGNGGCRPECEGGQEWNGSACVCPAGQCQDDIQCPPEGKPWLTREESNMCLCPIGKEEFGSACVDPCPSGETRQPDGSCKNSCESHKGEWGSITVSQGVSSACMGGCTWNVAVEEGVPGRGGCVCTDGRCSCSAQNSGQACSGDGGSSGSDGGTTGSDGGSSGSDGSDGGSSGSDGSSGEDGKCDPAVEVCGDGGGPSGGLKPFQRPEIPEYNYSGLFSNFTASVQAAPVLDVPSFTCGGSGSCPPLTVLSATTTLHCELMDTAFPLMSAALMVIAAVIAVRVVVSA